MSILKKGVEKNLHQRVRLSGRSGHAHLSIDLPIPPSEVCTLRCSKRVQFPANELAYFTDDERIVQKLWSSESLMLKKRASEHWRSCKFNEDGEFLSIPSTLQGAGGPSGGQARRDHTAVALSKTMAIPTTQKQLHASRPLPFHDPRLFQERTPLLPPSKLSVAPSLNFLLRFCSPDRVAQTEFLSPHRETSSTRTRRDISFHLLPRGSRAISALLCCKLEIARNCQRGRWNGCLMAKGSM
ncbi:hypothetical protein CEXT_309691 [Caerostris extrusa]|uniref:Uncharacterized protein n=1 Tax=Caerostris extrusa TaxID=172846 RepID=A0AAV4NI89_CAEEX|nr:hypothetical protein CEXT_309691 [Caerostris extrusa]